VTEFHDRWGSDFNYDVIDVQWNQLFHPAIRPYSGYPCIRTFCQWRYDVFR
jgi:hypothetical protein